MKILVTSFDPFGGEAINPAYEVVKGLPSEIKGAEIIKLQVPTAFGESAELVKQAIDIHHPDVVLHLGQAGGRSAITPERIAINLDDARIPDNAGQQPIDQTIQEDGLPAYFSNLPVKAMVDSIRDAGIPSTVSNSAGTFVCNHLMYQSLYLSHQLADSFKAGFIHIPYLPEQVEGKRGLASMPLDVMIQGISLAIEAIINHPDSDVQSVGGALH